MVSQVSLIISDTVEIPSLNLPASIMKESPEAKKLKCKDCMHK